MKPSNGRGKPSPFRKSEVERGDRSKSGKSARLEKGSAPSRDSVSPPNPSEGGSCCEAAVTVDDVDAGEDTLGSRAGVDAVVAATDVLDCDSPVGCAGGGARDGSEGGFEGLLPVTGLQTPELSSGQRKTSMGPLVLLSDTW